LGSFAHRQLEHRVTAQRVGIVAVLVAGRDHQHARADNVVQAVDHPARIARVTEAGCEAGGDGKPLLHLAQRQQAPSDDMQPPSNRATIALPPTGDRPGSIGVDSTLTGMLFRDPMGMVSTSKSYIVSADCTMPVTHDE